jgi:hypothetical protein
MKNLLTPGIYISFKIILMWHIWHVVVTNMFDVVGRLRFKQKMNRNTRFERKKNKNINCVYKLFHMYYL